MKNFIQAKWPGIAGALRCSQPDSGSAQGSSGVAPNGMTQIIRSLDFSQVWLFYLPWKLFELFQNVLLIRHPLAEATPSEQ
ncbi:hypothetical protein [Hymenobacter glacialis]|uniref:hypothetical protein n=1 Tax=Hymenobacter glacialis TaxID=1908236 RepID=UPI000F79A935|nr:hypothetical protein [Hymenobacter glacialis]